MLARMPSRAMADKERMLMKVNKNYYKKKLQIAKDNDFIVDA
jgi:hypothetical protein